MALADPDKDTRCAAIRALGPVANSEPRVLDALLAALSDTDSSVRQAAAETLGQLGMGNAEEVIDTMIELLLHSHWLIRETAAEGLGKLGKSNIKPEAINAFT